MAIGTGTALALGGAAIVGGVSKYMGSRAQAGAAREAARTQLAAGREARDILSESGAIARGDIGGYSRLARDQLGETRDMLSQQGAVITDRFQPQVEVGNEALSRLRSALLGGDMSAVQMDPGYQFRLQQGEQALQRAAAASGGLGGGAFLKDTARFSQGLASQEYGAAVNRLLGLQQIGSRATTTQAGLAASLLGQRAGLMGQESALLANTGSALAGVQQQMGANQASALTGAQTSANQFNLMGGQAQAQGIQGIGDTIQQVAMMSALMGGGGGPAATSSAVSPALSGRGHSIVTGTPGGF